MYHFYFYRDTEMPADQRLQEILACPRCDKKPLAEKDGDFLCDACKVAFPHVGGIPWLFAEPQASLGEWRNRLHFALQQLARDVQECKSGLAGKAVDALTQKRLQLQMEAAEAQRIKLRNILEPVDIQSSQAGYETYLALRTRLPSDQGLNTYYANIHRDWAWGDEENIASLAQISKVRNGADSLGSTLVLGAGACRLAYDVHMQLGTSTTVAVDFNPLLMLVAKSVIEGERPELYEFPIAPKSLDDYAVLRTLSAPEVVGDNFFLVLADALRPPFAIESFDTVITPWLIDIISEDLLVFASRVNTLLKLGGRWINFGSLAFNHPQKSRCYSPEETVAIVAATGFDSPITHEEVIPYMCSPASRHGRQETTFSFSAVKTHNIDAPKRHQALPDWIVTGKEPVPLSPSFRTQAMSTQIYTFIMSLIDGKRSIRDMAKVLEQQQLMNRAEAEPAIRNFLTKMYDDSQRQSGF